MSLNLRKNTRVNYYEPDEPRFDDYIYCDQCQDFVYDYCAIHGPILIIPDDKVPSETNLPSFVPRAALTIPHIFLHLAPSIIPNAGIGVFSTLTLPRGVRFGPYRGQRTNVVNSMYCWQIHNRHNKFSHVVDAVNSDRSNWMRYVNCARHWKEQNLLAYQYKGQLYYRTIKIIPRFTELLVFYGSEYANALQINLPKYNCVEYYRQVINTQTQKAPLAAKIPNTEHDNITNQQIHFIDEEKLFKEKSPNIKTQETTVPSNINNTTRQININPDSKFECETCNRTFLKQRYLKRHKILHATTWRFECEKCDYKTNFQYRFKRHLAVIQHVKKGEKRELKCDNCSYVAKTKYNLARHIKRVHK